MVTIKFRKTNGNIVSMGMTRDCFLNVITPRLNETIKRAAETRLKFDKNTMQINKELYEYGKRYLNSRRDND